MLYMQAALYLGLRKMEWLFLTCHNINMSPCEWMIITHSLPIHKRSASKTPEPSRALLSAIPSILLDAFPLSLASP